VVSASLLVCMEKVRIHTRPARRDGSFFEWLCRSERCANGQRKKKLEELHVGSIDEMMRWMSQSRGGPTSFIIFSLVLPFCSAGRSFEVCLSLSRVVVLPP
jgi:hypothetical protein